MPGHCALPRCTIPDIHVDGEFGVLAHTVEHIRFHRGLAALPLQVLLRQASQVGSDHHLAATRPKRSSAFLVVVERISPEQAPTPDPTIAISVAEHWAGAETSAGNLPQ